MKTQTKKGRETKDYMSEVSLDGGKRMIFILCGKFATKTGLKAFHIGASRDLTVESVAQARQKASTFIEFKLSKALKDHYWEQDSKRFDIDTSKKIQCIFTKPPKSLIDKLRKNVANGKL